MTAAGHLLGCGDNKLYITPGGGGHALTEVFYTTLSYSRRLDEISDSRTEVSGGQSAPCARLLGELEPFEYEVSIFRDGLQTWLGPITEPNYGYNSMTIQARDLLQWFERRILGDHAFANTDFSAIAAAYIADALDPDLSPNIEVDVGLSGVTGDRSTRAIDYRRAADEIRELARTGLDMAAIVRKIYLSGIEIDAAPLIDLTADVFEVDVNGARLAGLQKANDVYVIGTAPQGITTVPVGHAGGVDYPLVTQVYNESSIRDAASAQRAAETRWDLLNRAPTYITGTLLAAAPIGLEDLIPGVHVRLRQQVGFRMFDAPFRLYGVDVDARIQPSGREETVKLTLEPIGTELTGSG